MKAKAKHTVSYKGRFYSAGQVFPIDPEDGVMMSEYCELLEDEPEPEKRRGRTRKETAD